MDKLRALLDRHSAGPIHQNPEIEHALASCWHKLDGSADGGMEGYKLKNRMESVVWNRPILEFNLERHGATVNGSVFAGVQHWSINTLTAEGSLRDETRRRVQANNTSLKVGSLVDEITTAVMGRIEDRRLNWESDLKVKILMENVIPATNQQTTSARRKRFWNLLEEKIKPHGWIRRTARSPYIEKPV